MVEQVLVADTPDVLESHATRSSGDPRHRSRCWRRSNSCCRSSRSRRTGSSCGNRATRITAPQVAIVLVAGPAQDRDRRDRRDRTGEGLETAHRARAGCVRVREPQRPRRRTRRTSASGRVPEPYRRLNSAPKDSLDTRTTLSRPSPPARAGKARSRRPSSRRVSRPPPRCSSRAISAHILRAVPASVVGAVVDLIGPGGADETAVAVLHQFVRDAVRREGQGVGGPV